MKYQTKRIEDVLVVYIQETRLTSVEAPDAKTEMLKILSEDAECFIFNLNQIETMDSTGLGALLFGVRQGNNLDKDVCFCEAQKKVQFLVRIAHLEEMMDIYSSEQEAINDCLGNEDPD